MTLWGLVVPEGMAYAGIAGIAGMPPEAGLYTAMAALVAYAVFGSSRQLVVVGTSATAALLAGTVAALNPEDAGTYLAYAAALVLLVGVLFVLAGLARLGFIAQFLSSRPSVTALGRVPGSEELFTALVRSLEAVPLYGVLIIRTDEPVYYANAVSNRDAGRDLVRSTVPSVTTVVFDPQVQHDLDFTTVDILTELLDWLEARDIDIYLVASHSDLVAIAKRAGLIHLIGRLHIAPTLPAVLAQLGRDHPAETTAPDS